MSPLEIEILLWYYSRAEDHPSMYGDQPPAFKDALRRFSTMEGTDPPKLLSPCPQGFVPVGVRYKLTARGRAFVEAILALPLPEKRWVMPTTDAPSMHTKSTK